MRSGTSNLTVATLSAATYTAPMNGAGVDLRMFDGNIIQIATGAFGGTTPAVRFKIQESEDNVTFTDVQDYALDGITGNLTDGTALAAGTELTVGYIGDWRYIRVILTSVTGTTPTIALCALVTCLWPKQIS